MQSSIGAWQTSKRSSHRERTCELDTQKLMAVVWFVVGSLAVVPEPKNVLVLKDMLPSTVM